MKPTTDQIKDILCLHLLYYTLQGTPVPLNKKIIKQELDRYFTFIDGHVIQPHIQIGLNNTHEPDWDPRDHLYETFDLYLVVADQTYSELAVVSPLVRHFFTSFPPCILNINHGRPTCSYNCPTTDKKINLYIDDSKKDALVIHPVGEEPIVFPNYRKKLDSDHLQVAKSCHNLRVLLRNTLTREVGKIGPAIYIVFRTIDAIGTALRGFFHDKDGVSAVIQSYIDDIDLVNEPISLLFSENMENRDGLADNTFVVLEHGAGSRHVRWFRRIPKHGIVDIHPEKVILELHNFNAQQLYDDTVSMKLSVNTRMSLFLGGQSVVCGVRITMSHTSVMTVHVFIVQDDDLEGLIAPQDICKLVYTFNGEEILDK